MLASAAITRAAATAIVSATATATATRAQAARRWPVPGAVPGIPTIASLHGLGGCVMSRRAALGADRDAGIGPPARLAGTGASTRPDRQADTHGEQPQQAKQERQRVGAEGIMDADDGQDQASGAEDEAAVGSGPANKAGAVQRGRGGRDEDRGRQPADDERHAAKVVKDQGELRADSTVVGPQRHDGGGRAELDGDHDRARDDTGTRGDAATPAPGSAAQDVGEIAQEDEK